MKKSKYSENPMAACRIAAGMLQEEVAAAVGVDRSAVAHWESGRTVPRTEKLLKLARLYGCTVEALLGGESA